MIYVGVRGLNMHYLAAIVWPLWYFQGLLFPNVDAALGKGLAFCVSTGCALLPASPTIGRAYIKASMALREKRNVLPRILHVLVKRFHPVALPDAVSPYDIRVGAVGAHLALMTMPQQAL